MTEEPSGRWVSDSMWEFAEPLVFWPDGEDEPIVIQRLDMSIFGRDGVSPRVRDEMRKAVEEVFEEGAGGGEESAE